MQVRTSFPLRAARAAGNTAAAPPGRAAGAVVVSHSPVCGSAGRAPPQKAACTPPSTRTGRKETGLWLGHRVVPMCPPRPRMPPVHPLPSSMPLRRPCIAATTTTTPSSQPHTPWFPPPKKLASQKHLRADHCQSKLELRGRSDHGRQSAPSHLRPLPGLAKMRPNLINF